MIRKHTDGIPNTKLVQHGLSTNALLVVGLGDSNKFKVRNRKHRPEIAILMAVIEADRCNTHGFNHTDAARSACSAAVSAL